MKTIAITIDEALLARLDRFKAANRSLVVREAVAQYLARFEREAEDAREHEILRRHGAGCLGRLLHSCARRRNGDLGRDLPHVATSLTGFVSTLSGRKQNELRRALANALQLD